MSRRLRGNNGYRIKRGENRIGWLLVSPYILFGAVFFLIPLIWTLYLAFTDWNLISPRYSYVGVTNFVKAVSDAKVHKAFFVTYRFFLLFVPVVIISSMVEALVIYHIPKFKTVFIIGFFLPYLASGVASSVVVRGLLSYDSSINAWIRHVFGININWLNSSVLAPMVIALIMVWKFSGYYALIIESGLESIPVDVYEAADLDGASGWQRFFKITLPLLYPAFYTVAILATGVVFHIFTEPYLLTNGGPDGATTTWVLQIYDEAFNKLNTGYGSAVAIMAAMVTFLSIGLIRKILEKWGKSNAW